MFSLKKIFKYVWPQMREQKGAFYFILFVYAARVLLDNIISPLVFKQLIDLFSSPITDRSVLSDQIFNIFFIIAALNVFIFGIARYVKFAYYKFSARVVRNLRDFSFQKISGNSYTFFSNTFAGSLVTKARKFAFGFDSAFEVFLFSFLQSLVILVGALVVLAFQAPSIAIIFGIWAIVNFGIMSLLLKMKMKFDLLDAEQDSKISGRLADVFGNILAVKFFSASKKEIQTFKEYTQESEKRSNKSFFMGGMIDLIQHLLIIIIIIVVNYKLIVLWLQNSISIGTITLIETYIGVIALELWKLSDRMVKFMKALTDMKEMTDIFEIVPDIQDPKNPEKLNMKEGFIKFENVSFKYQVGENILADFNMALNSGERVGVVGHSGAGKSTLTKLILRFNDVTSGQITIDGQDIKNVTQDDLHSVISYVPQEPILFHRSIRENICYGKMDATDDEIIEVAKNAHAHEFILKLPQGYDTLVGERGVKLSGGERQRVAIARAMLKDSPILVLDEATSSLDSISESYIQDAFNELMKGKTTIVIAHRLSTIQKMDRIIVLDAGKIVEEGTHAELLAKGGMYKELWDHQTGGFLA
ncbi:MAG: ABC transporter ATP-binding protein [Candidatus Pacebacteria bacterium]|nr:ABC transporter ATP-binding protein [Candidatus Paceibacterota bacterium]